MNAPGKISVIIPVLGECDRINGLISRLRAASRDSDREIIVVDGDPSGSTIASISPEHQVTTITSAPGRAIQMNAGAARAEGDVLLFLHADTLLPDNAVPLIRRSLADSAVAGGAFELAIDSRRWYFRVTERYVGLRTAVTRIPFGDQAIFIRRTYFDEIGGYRRIPIMEDVDLMRRIRKRGDAIRIVAAKALTSSRRWEQEGVLYGTCRNLLLQFLYCCGVSPERLSTFYR